MGTVATISISGISYNVYSLTSNALGDAKSYFKGRLGATAWDSASTLTRQQALITATRGLDRALWSGEKLAGGQATQWPRTGATCNGDAVADGTPDEIALGTFELALSLLGDPTALDKKSTRTDIRNVTAGTAEVTFFQPPTGEETRFPTIVQELVGCFLAGSATVIGRPLASGTEEDSSFTEDDFELNEGLS
ncbi:MAG TPA: DnaT-like ssDNA-binding protein [Acidimicrobiia bacterium]|nr:DnaT-like ssDNA-binding protein [Acidimicrobiia bacterium]